MGWLQSAASSWEKLPRACFTAFLYNVTRMISEETGARLDGMAKNATAETSAPVQRWWPAYEFLPESELRHFYYFKHSDRVTAGWSSARSEVKWA